MKFSGHKPIVFFDGHCNLCNGSVRFLIERDPQANLSYASLQSETARELLGIKENCDADLSTVVFWEDGKEYYRSDAGVRIASHLSGGWRVLRFGRYVPKMIRDGIYNFIARNRYGWFGRSEQCMIPDEKIRLRFVENQV